MSESLHDTNSTEKHLCDALKRGEELAFTEIYERYFNELYISAYKILGTDNGADDSVQETFMSLWKYRAGLDIQNLRSYLHRSLRNAALKAYLLRKADTLFFERLSNVTNELLSADPLVYKELHSKLVTLIKKLPQDQQKIYNMSRAQLMTYQQIAEELQISIKTVEKKMSLSIKHLRIEILKVMSLLIIFQQ